MFRTKARKHEVDVSHRDIFTARLQKAGECLRNTQIDFNSFLRSGLDNDNCDTNKLSEGASDVESYQRFPIGSARHKYHNSLLFLSWSYLHSNVAEMRSKTGRLASYPKEFAEAAEAIDMVQRIMMSNFKKFWKYTKFNLNCSVSKHVANVTNHRLSPVKLLTATVRNFWFDNLELKIGESFIHVDRHLIRHYFQLFRNYTSYHLELPDHTVNTEMMVKLYNWVIRDDNELRIGRWVLVIYKMAKFMNMRYILEHYWTMLSLLGKKEFGEEEAIHAYLLTRELLYGDLMPIFLSRISKCFLPFVASIEFAALNIQELVFILKLDILRVNSEDEVFFAAIRWLEFNWKEREQHLDNLMAALRFQYLSPWLQYSIEYRPENYIIGKVGASHMVKVKLWQACLIGEASLAYHQYANNVNDILIKRYSLNMEVGRYWSCCKSVPHHHDVNCPQFRRLTYGSFKHFLNRLHCHAHKFMGSLMDIPYKHWSSYTCCDQVPSKKNTDSYLEEVIPIFYRFQQTRLSTSN